MKAEHFKGVQLNVVDSVEEAERFFGWLSERRGTMLACDTETIGLDYLKPNFVRLVQFGDGMTGWTISAKRWLGVIEEAFRRLNEPVVFHNAPFDIRALSTLDIPAPFEYHDTYIMSHLLENDGKHGLKPLSIAEYGWEAGMGAELLALGMKKGKWDWSTVPESFLPYTAYAAMDCVLTSRLSDRLLPMVDREIYDRESLCQDIYTNVGMRGIPVSTLLASELRYEWINEAAGLKAELAKIGILNPKSSVQIAKAFEEEFDWDATDFTDSGLPKMDGEVLKNLVSGCGLPSDAAAKIIRYKRLEKWCVTYLDKFADSGGRVYPSINSLRARSGRMSVTAPPIQTIPKESVMREVIRAEAGHEVWAFDYTAQELCMLVHFSKDDVLANALGQQDMHKFVASLAYGVPAEEVTADQRSIAKNVQYARLYGAGPAKMAVMSGVTEAEITQFLSRYNQEFPGVAKFIEKVESTGRQRLVSTGRATVNSWGGRKLSAGYDKQGKPKIYALLNYLIQGSCADLLKVKTLALHAEGLSRYILAPVHDEIVFSLPKGSEGAEIATTIKEILDETEAFYVPITVTKKGPGKSWGDLV